MIQDEHVKQDNDENKEGKITVAYASFTVISLTIGAGMVAMPRSWFDSGLPFGVWYNIFNFAATIYSIHLYYESARVTNLWSIPRIGYECFGYASFYIASCITFLLFGLFPIAYMMIFAGLSSSLIQEIPFVKQQEYSFLGKRWFSVLILATWMFPLIIRRKIQELKILGFVYFCVVITFIVLMLYLIITSSEKLPYKPGDSKEFMESKLDRKFLSSLSVSLVAFAFQPAFFSLWNAVKEKTYKNWMLFWFYGLGFWFVIYMAITFIGLYSFGVQIKGNCLDNVTDLDVWQAYIMRVTFLIVISWQTPFIFFVGKESLLEMIALIYTQMGYYQKHEDEDDDQLIRQLEGQNEQFLDNYGKSLSIKNSNVLERYTSDCSASMPIAYKGNKQIKSMVMSYKDEGEYKSLADNLPSYIWYIATIWLYAVVVTTACLTHEVKLIIDFVGSLGTSIIDYSLPGIYYFVIMRKYKALGPGQAWEAWFALIFGIYGILIGIFCTVFNVWAIISPP